MRIVISIIYCGLIVGMAILVLSSCRTQCPQSYSRRLIENSNPEDHVKRNVIVNGERYVIIEDTVSKRTIKIEHGSLY